MPLSGDDADAINEVLETWRQGDLTLDAGLEFFHLGDLARPHSSASQQLADALTAEGEAVPEGAVAISDDAIVGLVVLSQTCDIVRDCRDRPFVEVAPLIEVSAEDLEHARRLKIPSLAYIPGVAGRRLVAHLDRVMTVEKALVARWTRTAGCEHDHQIRDFAAALARKRARFAFPDDFVLATKKFQKKITEKHEKNSADGAHLRALHQIRVRAAPSWDAEDVHLDWWFIKAGEPEGVEKSAWDDVVGAWVDLFDTSGRFSTDGYIICGLDDMTGRDYVESDVLELEYLSVSRVKKT